MTTGISIPTRIEAVHKRLGKARAIVDLKLIEQLEEDVYIVYSQSPNGGHYTIDTTGCECPDVKYAGDTTAGWCKHKLAVELFKETYTDTVSEERGKTDIEGLYPPEH